MQVFAVFEICNGSYDDIYKLSHICSTLENTLNAIKEASLRNLNLSLKFYIKEVEQSVADPLEDYIFCESYKQLRDLLSENSEKLKSFFRSYVYMSYTLDESFNFKIDNCKYLQGPFELSKEQKDEIESVLQNKLYHGHFEQIQLKKLEE